MIERRYGAVALAAGGLIVLTALAATRALSWWWVALPLAFCIVGAHDMLQKRHAILRNYPIWGHARFFLEFIRPEIRQYFIEDETSEAPFSRAQRSLVYQRAKNEVDSRPFGTEFDVKRPGYEWISHSLAPTRIASSNFRITVGADRAQPYDI